VVACSNQKSELQQINISQTYPERTISYQDLGDVEYVVLETTNNVLLAAVHKVTYVSDLYIVAYNPAQGDIFVFNREGTIRNHINHKGEGPMEYSGRIQSLVFDEKNEEIFVYTTSPSPRFQVYSLNGKYKRSLTFTSELTLRGSYNWDDNTLLAYDEKEVPGQDYRIKPYLLISKKDGTIISELDIAYPIRFNNRFIEETPEGKRASIIYMDISRSDGRDFMFGEICSDTIFLSNRKILLTKTPSVHTIYPKVAVVPILKTDKFVILERALLSFSKEASKERLFYDFKTGEVYTESFVNNDYPERKEELQVEVSTEKNIGVYTISTYKLVEAYKEGRLPEGKLKEIASKLQEDDNEVLMLVKFKSILASNPTSLLATPTTQDF
jgi:hypothetical protein